KEKTVMYFLIYFLYISNFKTNIDTSYMYKLNDDNSNKDQKKLTQCIGGNGLDHIR
ncbi:hypothetical protein ACJX0J_008048, partial [Zea mays]